MAVMPTFDVQLTFRKKIPLTTLIAIWDVLHNQDTGTVGFCDFTAAVEAAGVEVVNDIDQALSRTKTGL